LKLSREQVLHIAELARLGLSDEETDLFAEQLSDILGYIEKLNRLATDDIHPTAQTIRMRNVTRADEVSPSLAPDEALANAPKRRDDALVKPILD